MKLFRAFYADSERHSQEELLNCMKFRVFQGRPEEIIKNPGNGFVREFILKQLEIKKNNIYSLFTVPKNIPGVAAGKVQEILTGREELVQVS